jgi:cytochrome c peroxidase
MPRDPVAGRASGFGRALPEPMGSRGTERTSAGLDRAEALERVAVRRQHLSFRSPLSYFHNGFAKDLDAVIDFYEDRFQLNLNKQERSDLIAFLRAL